MGSAESRRSRRRLVIALCAAAVACALTWAVADDWRRIVGSQESRTAWFDEHAPTLPFTWLVLVLALLAITAFSIAIFDLLEGARKVFDLDSSETDSGRVSIADPWLPAVPDELEERITERLERLATLHPRRYRLHLLVLEIVGYGGMLAFAFACAASLAAVGIFGIETTPALEAWKVFPFVGFALALTARSVILPRQEPHGVRIHPNEYPVLFDRIEQLRLRTRAPKIHEVVIDDRCNAGVHVTPRFGCYRFATNRLILGLPILLGLGPDEFDSVLAHELGHLSLDHPRYANREYHLANAWYRFAHELANHRRIGRGIMLPFYRWFAGSYVTAARTLARQHEVRADAICAAASSPRAFVDSQVRALILELRYESEVRDKLRRRRRDESEPPVGAFDDLRQFMTRPLNEAATARRLELELRFPPRRKGTHPSLRERLSSVTDEPRLPQRLEVFAADRLLGTGEDELIRKIDSYHRDRSREAWIAEHEAWTRRRSRMATLDLRVGEAMTKEEIDEHAALCMRFDRFAEALSGFRQLVERDPTDAYALFGAGCAALQLGDEVGLRDILKSVDHAPHFALTAYRIIAGFERKRGNESSAEEWRKRAHSERIEIELFDLEARDVRTTDRLHAHGLADDARDQLVYDLARIPELGAAWLVREETTHQANRQHYVLGVVRKRHLLHWFDRREACAELVRVVSDVVGLGRCLVVSLERRSEDVVSHLVEAAWQPIYRASARPPTAGLGRPQPTEPPAQRRGSLSAFFE